MWVSKHGIMRASGYTVQNLTENTFICIPDRPSDGEGNEPYCSAIINNSYYFMISSNTLYKLDMGQGNSLSKIEVSGLTQVFAYENRLYGNIANNAYELFVSNTEGYAWEYTTKEFAGQSYDSEIEWLSYKVAYQGTVTIETFINGVSIQSVVMPVSTTRATHKVLLPASANKGSTVQFKLNGLSTSKVYSLRAIYSYLNLEN